MKKFLLGLTAVLAAAGIAGADDPKPPPSRARSNQPAPPAAQNRSRPSGVAVVPRYSNQPPRFNGYANLPETRRYPGNSAVQNNGLANRDGNWRRRQFDNRNLADQNTNGIAPRNWRHFDLSRRGDLNDVTRDANGRRDRNLQNISLGQNTLDGHRGDRVLRNDGTPVVNAGRNRRGNPVVTFNNGDAVSFSDARRRCHDFGRGHDRDWWHRRCHTIILIGGGFWAWDAGWWYPAWGYDSSYSNYAYNGPIYGYDGLAPDQVIANVQSALQELGYFPYAVDGVLGPSTQQAIADYQRDQGLPMTGAIDRPTLLSLGFIY
jgi:Putative peptidoglycan binding domain